MAGKTDKITIAGVERQTFYEELSEAGVTSPPTRFTQDVSVQLSGTATDIVAVVERSSQDPGSGEENWAPVEGETFTGDLSAGIPPRAYIEPAAGWWRVRVSTLTGGYVRVSMAGGDL